jgi:ketosteroid isomerase-like protein
MMRFTKAHHLLFVLAVIAVVTSAQTKNAEKQGKMDRIHQTILLIEQELFTAIKAKDATALNRILGEDFVYRNPGNDEIGKADFLKTISSSPINIISLWGEEMKVNVFGEVAILTGLQLAKTKNSEGKEELSAGMFTDVFARRSGRWELVLAHAVDLPQVPPQYLPKK